jgi:tetratricopeptide (TPR) repeat protein
VVETLLQIAEDFRWLDDVDRSRELNLEALALLDTLPAPDPELRAVLLGRIGLDGIYRGLHEESLAQIEESVSIYAGLGAKPAEHSIALGRLGEAQLRTGRFEEALATYREAPRLAWEARDPLSISLIAGNVALVQVLVYDPEPAEAMLVEALAFVEREAPAGSVAIPNVRTSLATWLFETGRFEEAVELQERALEEVRALFDPGHTEFLKVQVSLGRSLVAAGRTDEALAHFRPVAASGSSFHVALARFGQGLCALAAGAVEEGIAHIRAAWPGILEWMAQGDPFRIEYAFVLLSALVRAERYEQAEEQYASLAAELRAATRYGVAPKPEALPQAFQDVLVLGLEQEFAALLDEVLATLGERLPARQRAAIAAVRPQALDAAAPPAAR